MHCTFEPVPGDCTRCLVSCAPRPLLKVFIIFVSHSRVRGGPSLALDVLCYVISLLDMRRVDAYGTFRAPFSWCGVVGAGRRPRGSLVLAIGRATKPTDWVCAWDQREGDLSRWSCVPTVLSLVFLAVQGLCRRVQKGWLYQPCRDNPHECALDILVSCAQMVHRSGDGGYHPLAQLCVVA